MRDASSNANDPGASRKRILALISVVAIFVLALFLRAYWNVDAAATPEGFVLSAGSDPYYHKRAIDYIQDNGWKTLLFDPLLNYPYGAVNPNPPLFEWSVAVSGAALAPFFGGDLDTATWWAMLWSPAIWGALTVIPTYLIGRDVFNRRTGIVAGFLLAVSTTHIDHTALGAADHDAMLLFFGVFAFWAYIRSLQGFKGDQNWVRNWNDSQSRSAGLKQFFQERRSAIGYAALAGVFIGAVGLMWKGFPYLIGVMFAYAAFAMVVDHWRNKDSTGLWLGTAIAFLVGTLLVVPAYSASNVLGFLKPVWFLIAAHIVFGLVMVPTRDLPTLLVIPAFAVVGLLGLLVAFFVVPEVAQSLLYATVYFKQTSIYQTIAEAHPADFNTMVFGIGPVAFFLALFGLVYLTFTAARRPSRANLFMVVWALIAIYMAHSAVRFLFNATPVLAVLAGWTVVLILDWLKFGAISKSMRGATSFWSGFRRAVSGWQVTAAVLLALLLVFPSIFLAVDAATPPSYEQRFRDDENESFMKGFVEKRMGAFGQGFLPDYWNEGLTELSQIEDFGSDPGNVANRPGFLSWWDYGHWAIEVGEHPAVADNFQNGYNYAAEFLLAQNETHSVQLLSARSFGLIGEAKAKDLLAQAGVPANQTDESYALMRDFEYAPAVDLETAVELEALVQEATKSDVRPDGVRIRYFGTDIRMLPYDLPQTAFIEQSSIFYAPVVLAEKDPADFVELQIRGTDSQVYSEEDFLKKLKDVTRNPNFGSQGQKYTFKQPFFDSMYYRGFVGTPVNAGAAGVDGDRLDQALQVARPGFGLEHWRLSVTNDQLRVLEYYRGAVVEGVVAEDGRPLAGVTVTAYDDAGRVLHEGLTDLGKQQFTAEDLNVPHDSATTDASGRYSLLAPFNLPGGNVTIVASRDGVEVARQSIEVSRADADTGREFDVNLDVEKGTVEGFTYFDKDENGVFNATAGDSRVGDVLVSIGGVNATADADGDFTATEVSAGSRAVTVTSDEYSVSPFSTRVTVNPDATAEFNVALRLKTVTVGGNVSYDSDGDDAADGSVPGTRLVFTATPGSTSKNATATVTANGTYDVSLTPGAYTVRTNYTADGVEYEFEGALDVPRASTATFREFDVLLRRT